MTRLRLFPVVCLSAGLLVANYAPGQMRPAAKAPKSKEAKIRSAMSVAPAIIAKDATILDWSQAEGGMMVELRKGTNGWTCLPDMPSTPVNDPMCMDKNAMEWAQAWMSKKEPKLSGVGIGYMLQGGATADNDGPPRHKASGGQGLAPGATSHHTVRSQN